MGRFDATRRTGVITAGLVPPPGVPLPQRTVAALSWSGQITGSRDRQLRRSPGRGGSAGAFTLPVR